MRLLYCLKGVVSAGGARAGLKLAPRQGGGEGRRGRTRGVEGRRVEIRRIAFLPLKQLVTGDISDGLLT